MITIHKWATLSEDEKVNILNDNAIGAGLDSYDMNLIIRDMGLFDRFVSEAHKVVDLGYEHYSAEHLLGFLRHHTALQGKDKTFKVNNNLKPLFSRISMAVFPKLNGLFELRQR